MSLDYRMILNDIVSNISFEGLGYNDNEPKADGFDAVQYSKKEFDQWYKYSEGSYKTKVEAVGGYLSGLPSWCSLPFMNHDILILARKWGSITPAATEEEEEKILSGYWNFLGYQFLKLWSKKAGSNIYQSGATTCK